MATGGIIHALHFATHRPEPIRQASLLMVLAAGVSRGEDVISMLRSYSRESKPPWSSKVLHLAVLLEQGGTLADSVAVIDGLLPEESVIAIRVAEQGGGVEAILADEALRLSQLSQRPQSSSILAPLFIGMATLSVAAAITLFLTVFIVPKYKDVWAGFDLELPRLSQMLFNFWDELGGVVILTGLPVFGFIVFGIVFVWKSHRSILHSGWSTFFDWRPRWRSPMILRQLSLATMTRVPMDNAFHALLRVMQPGRTATKLSQARQAVAGGTNWPDALQAAGFLNQRETRFLESATRTHHEDWAMRHLAGTLERRQQEKGRRIVSMIWPCLIVIIGLIVAFIVFAFFLPVVDLMQHLILNADKPLTFS